MVCYLRALGTATGDRFLTKLTGATLKSQAKVYILWVKTEVSHLSGRSHFNFTKIFNYPLVWMEYDIEGSDSQKARQFCPQFYKEAQQTEKNGCGQPSVTQRPK